MRVRSVGIRFLFVVRMTVGDFSAGVMFGHRLIPCYLLATSSLVIRWSVVQKIHENFCAIEKIAMRPACRGEVRVEVCLCAVSHFVANSCTSRTVPHV